MKDILDPLDSRRSSCSRTRRSSRTALPLRRCQLIQAQERSRLPNPPTQTNKGTNPKAPGASVHQNQTMISPLLCRKVYQSFVFLEFSIAASIILRLSWSSSVHSVRPKILHTPKENRKGTRKETTPQEVVLHNRPRATNAWVYSSAPRHRRPGDLQASPETPLFSVSNLVRLFLSAPISVWAVLTSRCIWRSELFKAIKRVVREVK